MKPEPMRPETDLADRFKAHLVNFMVGKDVTPQTLADAIMDARREVLVPEWDVEVERDSEDQNKLNVRFVCRAAS